MTQEVLAGKTIVLGVSGGIAAYKACDIASRLTQDGATVRVVLTAGAQRFVTALTFEALTHGPVHTSLWNKQGAAGGDYQSMPHIALADEADAILIAPASANIIARLAHGLADDLLSTLVLATRAPVLLAPAMNPTMLQHLATQGNLARARELGYDIIDPDSGRMACEHVGSGRLPATEVLLAELARVLNVSPSLEGNTVLVTAGPTREPIDAVRYIGNRSSGRMGFSLAAEAARRGATTIMVSGPSTLPTPAGVQRVNVTTCAEMLEAVRAHAAGADIVIAAAAPADFRPLTVAPCKVTKSELGGANWHLELAANPDIVAEVARGKAPHQVVIGFAAETGDAVAAAREKLSAKRLDAIVANDVTAAGAGFDVATNVVTWITPDTVEAWPLMNKSEVAKRMFDTIDEMLTTRAKLS